MEEQLNTSTASPQPEINTKHDVDQRLKDSDDTIAQEGDDDQSPTFQQVLERGAFAECKTEQKSLLAAAKTHHFLLKQNSAFLKARRRFSSSNNNIDDGEESKLSKESKLKFASLPQLASTAAIKQQLQLQTELQQQPQTLAHTQAYLAESIQLYHGLTGSGNDVNDDSEGCPEEIESVLAVGIASRIAAFNVMTTSTLPTSKSNGSIAAIENDKSPCIAVDSSTFQEEIALSSMKTNQFGETLDLDVVPVVSPRESEKSGESLPETTVQDCIDLNLDVERPSQCATPKPHVGSERLSIAVSSSFSDTRESVSSAYASISNTATTTRYISPHVDSHQWPESASSIRSSNASVGTTKTTNSAALYDASSSSKNPMKPRKSFMSTVSTSSSIASSQTTRSIPFSEKGLGPFWVFHSVAQRLESDLDYGFFTYMNFKTQGGADNFDSDEDDDDFGMLSASRGPGIQVGKQLSDPQYEIDEDGGTAVKSGSLPCLTALLWSNISAGGADQKLISDFLMTYRYFAISQDVARLLALSYLEVEWWANLKTSSNQADSEDTLNHSLSYPISKFIDDLAAKYSNGSKSDEWAGFLQLRILNVLKKWIDLHPDDFTMNKDLLDFTLLFLEKKVERDVKRAKHGTAILSNLKQKVKEYELNRYVMTPMLPSTHVSARHQGNTQSTQAQQHQLSSSSSIPKSSSNSSLAASINSTTTTTKSRSPSETPQIEKDKSPSWSLRRKFTFKTGSPQTREPTKSNTPSISLEESISSNSPQISKTPLRQHSRSASHQIVEDDEDDDAGNSNSNTAASKKKPMSLALSIAAALNEMEPPLAPPKKFSEFDPTLFAKQITLLEHSHFRKIKIDEFYGQAWAKKKAGSGSAAAVGKSRLVAFINWFNRVAYGVATEVVKPQVIKERVTMLKRFIFIAELCVKWNNYNTAFEIVAGLNLGPVSRLTKTWKALPTKYVDVWNKLNKIVSSESSYRTYRQLMNQFNQFSPGAAVLPYLGVNLSDLTFTEDGNPSYNSDDPATGERIINFSKFRMISKILGGILKSQVGQYDFVFDDDVQRWLKNEWEAASSKELYDMSLLCEPRAAS